MSKSAFIWQYSDGYAARIAMIQAAKHGSDMDAPTRLPAGYHRNECPTSSWSARDYGAPAWIERN